ncbi:MAG TPA: GAF domain-containing sensor histidine kinase [Candidatus Limnocylindrales bacterium]|nr:GAF domain-containing sensor histidine kinase [Candidatus Limnocylindrales bacterium]
MSDVLDSSSIRTPAASEFGELLPGAPALAAVDEAARAISSVLGIEEVLQLIVDRVRDLVDARYAALGIAGVDGRIERFITAGVDPHERLAIGALPSGRGLLGLIIREGQSFRIPSIADHPDSVGFPRNHPQMTSFLGVPVMAHGSSVGNLYLTDKREAAEFSLGDLRLVELFASHAGIAIDNARLHAQAGRLAVAEERDRIGRDLHDGIIQSLYAVGLSLEDVPDLMAEAPDEASERVDIAIESINLAIRDIRNFIYGLRPEAVDGTQVIAGLAALAEEVRHGGLVDVVADLDGSDDPGLDADAGAELLNLVREALSNAVRHGHAVQISIGMSTNDVASMLEIADDGVGFDPAQVVGAGHHGLANMRARAAAIGGQLEIRSAPGEGTRVIVELPRPTSTTEDQDSQR